MLTLNRSKITNSQIILVFCLGVFGILSTELGIMGIIPVVSENFHVSIFDAGWSVSVFALVITFCTPIVPLLCANFNLKKLMLICLLAFVFSSLISVFIDEFWQLLIFRIISAFFILEAFDKAIGTQNKELFVLKDTTYIQSYYKKDSVNASLAKLQKFYEKYL
ncbi:MFS transporter [Campylobacter jejuni]|nr:MFS transporter [Campylobacter jejuni]EHN6902471.1 MFS transporter [Campylobacter jejuni]EHN6915471.1 MFS transporter [Campylobacter jejuni]